MTGRGRSRVYKQLDESGGEWGVVVRVEGAKNKAALCS